MRLFSSFSSHSPGFYMQLDDLDFWLDSGKQYKSVSKKLHGTSFAEISFKIIYWLFK